MLQFIFAAQLSRKCRKERKKCKGFAHLWALAFKEDHSEVILDTGPHFIFYLTTGVSLGKSYPLSIILIYIPNYVSNEFARLLKEDWSLVTLSLHQCYVNQNGQERYTKLIELSLAFGGNP